MGFGGIPSYEPFGGESSDIAYALNKDHEAFRLSFGPDDLRIEKVVLTGPEAIPADAAPRVRAFPSPTTPFLLAQSARRRQPLYRCELSPHSGEQEVRARCHVLIEDGKSVVRWLTTATGRIVARIRAAPDGQRMFQSRTSSGEWTTVFRHVPYYTALTPFGSVQRDGTVWALSNRRRERVALVRMNIATGTEEVFYEHDQHDLTTAAIHFDEHGEGMPLLVTYNPDYQVIVHFHDALEAAYDALYQRLGEPSRVKLISLDRMARTAVVEVENPQLHLSWRLLDLQKHTSRILSGSSLAPYPPSTSRPVTFLARDGLRLHGYLTLPRDAGATRPPPMILTLHGGPWSRYFWSEHAPVQFLANKGYAVLRLNYRGSSGYDRSFLAAGRGTLFGSMQHDVLDAVEWAIAHGYAKRGEIVLSGGSFGGFLTLVMLASHPDNFRAGIAINAATDAVAFWKTEWRNPLHRLPWREFLGSHDLPEVALAEISPVNNTHRIVAPIQLIVGSRDRRVPASQSRDLFHLLKEAGKAVDLTEFQDAGHEIPAPEFLAVIETFLDEHLPREPGTW